MGRIAAWIRVGLLAMAVALSAAAQEEPAPGAEAEPGGEVVEAPAEPEAPAEAEADAEEAPAAEETEPGTPARIEAFPGIIQKVTGQGILVRGVGQPSDPSAPALMFFTGKVGVPVKGEGKHGWMALRRNDVVLVSYEKGPPHKTRQVNVLPRPAGPNAPTTAKRQKPASRSFVGYIKLKEGDEIIVMQPRKPVQNAPAPPAKAFVRVENTQVTVLRDSWEALRKGDRVRILHQKGNPRPIDVLQVIRLGGEQPLPPGVATRLFDPRWDASVEDVDGIGETGPVPPLPKAKQSDRVQVRRQRPNP